MRSPARRASRRLPLLAVVVLGGSFALAGAPNVCRYGDDWPAAAGRAPAAVTEYVDSLGTEAFDLRAACALWARSYSNRRYNVASATGFGACMAENYERAFGTRPGCTSWSKLSGQWAVATAR